MNKIIHPLFFLFFSYCSMAQNCTSPGTAQIDLSVNNIQARILNSGGLWFDGAEGKYVAPKPAIAGFPEVSAIFAGGIWIGGQDDNGEIKLAAQQYTRFDKTDYFPGPLEPGADGVPEGHCENWDRFWVVNKTDVDSHIADFIDNNIIDNILPSIYGWPGKNNPFFQQYYGFELPTDHALAPFFDTDQDGNYNPENGDFPLIKGDQSIWWVFNDIAGPHTLSQAEPIGIEVQAMAYAEASENEHVNNATYYDFKIINQGTGALNKSYMGIWTDFDLGCPTDDYIGYDEEYQMYYAYNQDPIDGSNGTACINGINTYASSVPIIGIKQIGSPNFPVTSFMAGDNLFPPTSSPNNGFEYYNQLQGKWKNEAPMTFGDTGYNILSTDTVSFLFTGDPSDEIAWNMCNANLPNSDFRCLMSTSMETLQPGQSFTNSYAVIFVENEEYPCPNLDRLKIAADAVCNNVSTHTNEITPTFNLLVYPNPALDVLYIESERFIRSIQVRNMEGRLIRSKIVGESLLESSIKVDGINDGLYVVSIFDEIGNQVNRKVIIQE